MGMRFLRSCLMAVALLLTASGAAWSAPLSDRVVAYRIEGRYDAKTHTLDATELLTYTNHTGVRLDRIPAEIYVDDGGAEQRAARLSTGRKMGRQTLRLDRGEVAGDRGRRHRQRCNPANEIYRAR